MQSRRGGTSPEGFQAPVAAGGGLGLCLDWNGGAIVAAAVAAPRPLAARLLQGRPVAEAVALAPRLFALCGSAQGIAARRAVAAARGDASDPEQECRDRDTLAREVVGEHLWRLCLDWPLRLGLAPRRNDFTIWRRRLLAGDILPRAQLPAWGDFAAAAQGLPLCPRSALPLLPPMTARAWAAALRQAGAASGQGVGDEFWTFLAAFAATPALADGPRETGALVRWREHAVVAGLWAQGRRPAARLAARCLDLEALAAALEGEGAPSEWIDAVPLGQGCGLARVETARGPLLHLVQIKDERVERYVIVAPTEWNFHPRGAFVQDVTGLTAADLAAAERLARDVALSLDPCVALDFTCTQA